MHEFLLWVENFKFLGDIIIKNPLQSPPDSAFLLSLQAVLLVKCNKSFIFCNIFSISCIFRP